ncbi:putative alpha beta hydrolase protein [Rosellinia necatrix]|uniref:Putative alpha beta hydrolase protein n=1 Tax=Rosellinia necatrix TaxID=77044 RepID=A0A1W2TST7_ROSNE|nr:putative alpha beta hydrolase protein [Rosellinia necatrix]
MTDPTPLSPSPPSQNTPPPPSVGHGPTRHRLLVPDHPPAEDGAGSPLAICFHGSGETCSPAWDEVAAGLASETGCRVLLYDRGPSPGRPADVAAEMWEHVLGAGGEGLGGPYVLVAHSYGGAFARAFFARRRDGRGGGGGGRRGGGGGGDDRRVLGLALVETGQEGGLDAALDEAQIRAAAMGSRPVCVVRGDSLLGKRRALEARERAAAAAATATATLETGDTTTTTITTNAAALAAERDMLRRADAEDVRLKRRQLGLSRNSRFVQVSGCGHHVVRDRPDEVVDAVRWILENAGTGDGDWDEDKDKGVGGLWKTVVRGARRLGLRR